jgi:E3 ubiquitin-protein ligase RFWD3
MANFKSKEFFKIHDKCIRDVQFSPRGDGIVVTTGLDKTLQLSSIHSNVLVHKYSLPVPGWSCCWNYDQPTYIYCGLANGSIMIFDTRRTDCHVEELKRNDSLVPVTSLAYVPVCHASDLFCSGVLAGTLDGCVIWEKSHDTYKPHLLNTLSGSCTSVSFESTTRHCLASFRPSKRNPTSRHIVSQLKNNPAEGTIISNPLNHFKGSSTCSVLSRSTLFLQPNTTNQLRVAYSNESTKKICICDVSVDSTIQQLSTNNEPSLDTSIIDCGDRGTLLASLTQHNLYLFNWKI